MNEKFVYFVLTKTQKQETMAKKQQKEKLLQRKKRLRKKQLRKKLLRKRNNFFSKERAPLSGVFFCP
ncbi:MAG: hypothetical protein IPJ32_05870 [Sphingobacteriaceae bacterium]|nr:hypothetical protein [Sphingobacteriaceae bacterium]